MSSIKTGASNEDSGNPNQSITSSKSRLEHTSIVPYPAFWKSLRERFIRLSKAYSAGDSARIEELRAKTFPEIEASSFSQFVKDISDFTGVNLTNFSSNDDSFQKVSQLASADPLTLGLIWDLFSADHQANFKANLDKFSGFMRALSSKNEAAASKLGMTTLSIPAAQVSNFCRFMLDSLKITLTEAQVNDLAKFLESKPQEIRDLHNAIRTLKSRG